MPVNQTSGNLTTDAFGGGVAAVPAYIEDVFSTYLYTGNQTARNIVNNIDLSTKGGMVWIKDRTSAYSNGLFDTARGVNKRLNSNSTSAQQTTTDEVGAFNVDGFSLGNNADEANATGDNYASWTFRKQPKFFDIVTYTGNSTAGRLLSHSLGSTPGFIIIKNTTSATDWVCWHTAIPGSGGFLDTTDPFSPSYKYICNTVNSTVFSLDSASTLVNATGQTYVAYLFAHNAGGFGLTGTDNVISCGSFTQGSGDTAVTLGYEPQWVMIKSTDATGSGWDISDNMRGMPVSGQSTKTLDANLSNAESSSIYGLHTTATGFVSNGYTSGSFIYIAIRRGPMKVPTDATKVFKPFTYTTPSYQDTGTPIDSVLVLDAQTANVGLWGSRLVGTPPTLDPRTTNQETSGFSYAFQQGQGTSYYPSGVFGEKTNSYGWSRSPKFFDEVCYTGTGSARSITHNLGVLPELMIIKDRSSAYDWIVAGNMTSTTYKELYLDTNQACVTGSAIAYSSGSASITVAPTTTTFGVGPYAICNGSGDNYVAYLFATCAGVSKVGSFTGTGATQTIDCGFGASGARFVLIKRTDTSGNWYSFNSSSGFTSGSSPYMVWNGAATAETTGNNGCFAASTGVTVTSTASSTVNINGGNYIFLAIA